MPLRDPPQAHSPLTLPPICVEVWRGDVRESVHRAHAVMVDEAGRTLARAGDPERLTSARSTIKPFQAWATLRRGLIGALGLTQEEIALMCASHNGERVHVEVCEALLAKLKRGVGDLECGAHTPYSDLAARELISAKLPATAAHNNCSGKHCGMLALASSLGVESAGYTSAEHPVQREVLGALRALLRAGVGEERPPFKLGVDGCSLPTPELSLRELAGLFTRLAAARLSPAAPRDEALSAIFAAMAARPYLVAGAERFDTVLMTELGGEAVCKVGGEGLRGVALRPASGRVAGVAVKVEDGALRALNPATLYFLELAGVLDRSSLAGPLRDFVTPAVKSCRGEVVGELRARLEG